MVEEVVILLFKGCNIISKELYKDSKANYKANYNTIEERVEIRVTYYLIVLIYSRASSTLSRLIKLLPQL